MNRWLLKTEPRTYSWADLVREGTTVWDGVRAPAALKNMALMEDGDAVLVYHSGKDRSIMGTATVEGEPYSDPESEDPRHLVVRVAADKALAVPLSLAVIKASGRFQGWDLLRLPRLSVVPVSPQHWALVMAPETWQGRDVSDG